LAERLTEIFNSILFFLLDSKLSTAHLHNVFERNTFWTQLKSILKTVIITVKVMVADNFEAVEKWWLVVYSTARGEQLRRYQEGKGLFWLTEEQSIEWREKCEKFSKKFR
jgi:hypothetical protein